MKYTTCLLKRYGKTLFACLAAAVGAAVMLGTTCSVLNKAPTVPVISGPSAGVVGVPVTFKATATDPESDSIAFQFDWGDSSTLAWSDLIASGETASVQHTYSDSGTFSVKAKAKDDKEGKESVWSPSSALPVLGEGFGYPDTLLAEIVVEPGACAGAITPDGSCLYVAHGGSDFITPIRLANRNVLPAIEVDDNPVGVAVSPDGSHVYVCCTSSSTVVAVRTMDNTVDGRVAVASHPKSIAITPDGEYLFVAASDGLRVDVVRVSDMVLVDSVKVSQRPLDVVANPTRPYVYVDYGARSVGVIRTTDLQLVDSFSVGDLVGRMAISPNGEYLYVANQGDSGIGIVRTADNSVVGSVKVSRTVEGITALSDGRYVVTTDYYGLKYVDMRASSVVDSFRCGTWGSLAADRQGALLCVVVDNRVYVVGRR
jgi:YVTN family beta-propeller protein